MKPFMRSVTHWLAVFGLLATVQAQAETVTDLAGRQVEVPAKVERILLGEGRMLYALALLEGKNPLERIVGWQGELSTVDPQGYAAYKKQFPQIDDIPKVGKTSEASVSPEKVLALQPDIAIFGIAGHGPGKSNPLVDELTQAGVPVVFIDFRQHPLANTVPSLRLLGKVLHREQQAEAYLAFYEKHQQRIAERLASVAQDKRPSVFIEMLAGIGPGLVCCHTAGKGNFGEFIEAAGGRNIAADLLPGVIGDINLEHLISADPDVYLVSGVAGNEREESGIKAGAGVSLENARKSLQAITQRDGVATLSAVNAGRVHGIWHNYYNSPDNIIALEAFAKWFHPELFADVDLDDSFRELQAFVPVPLQGAYWYDLKAGQ